MPLSKLTELNTENGEFYGQLYLEEDQNVPLWHKDDFLAEDFENQRR